MKVSRKKIILLVVVVIFLSALFLGAYYLKSVMDYKKAVKET